jgi:phosphoribosylglycinamide formyltransferase-1
MKQKDPALTHIAIFASGAGTNAQNIISHFKNHPSIRVALLVSNKPEAGAIKIAQKEKIPTLVLEKERFFRGDGYMKDFLEKEIRFIVLAGFLWKIPNTLIRAYPHRIINIHPALLPKYGGRGMYGSTVHEAVIAAGEKQSGITIHYVDEVYDNGEIILQETCDVTASDTPDSLAKKIHMLEYAQFPKVIEKVIVNGQ